MIDSQPELKWTDDEQIVCMLRHNRQRGLESLFHSYGSDATRFAVRLVGMTHAEDVLQEAILNILRRQIPDRLEGKKLRTWFWKIVKNAARDWKRKLRRHDKWSSPDLADDYGYNRELMQSILTPEQIAEHNEDKSAEQRFRRRALWRGLIDRMPNNLEKRVVLAMWKAREWVSSKELAVELNSTVSSIDKARSKAMKSLRAAANEQGLELF